MTAHYHYKEGARWGVLRANWLAEKGKHGRS
jgi:hypothetical protein